jgi:urea transport system substrate-binding protein
MMASSTSSRQTEKCQAMPGPIILPESAVLASDWPELGCGMYNTETSTCVQIESNY